MGYGPLKLLADIFIQNVKGTVPLKEPEVKNLAYGTVVMAVTFEL